MSRDLRIVKVHGGVLTDVAGSMLGSETAHRIARRNGFGYAEQFVAAYTGQTLQLDDKLMITSRQCRCGDASTVHAGGSGPCAAKGCDCPEYREAMP